MGATPVDAPAWLEVTIQELADALPDEGVDVLVNPGSSASMRVLADEIKRAVSTGES